MSEQSENPPPTDETVHGGEGDPLGGGVSDLEDSEEVTEGVPQQEE